MEFLEIFSFSLRIQLKSFINREGIFKFLLNPQNLWYFLDYENKPANK